MMKKLFFGIMTAIALMALPAMADNTITISGQVINISSLDSDWTWTDSYPNNPNGLRVQAIIFIPGALDDQSIIKEGSDSGPALFDSDLCENNNPRAIYYNGALLKPVLDYDAGTYSSGSYVIIILGRNL